MKFVRRVLSWIKEKYNDWKLKRKIKKSKDPFLYQ